MAEDARDSCISLARRVGDAFKEACESKEPDEADANYASVKGALEELWDYAYLRDRPFRDLLALLEAASKRAELAQFSETQRDAIARAFHDLPRWMLDEDTVTAHVERFADQDIDITGPIRSGHGQRIRVIFEEVKE